MKHDWIGKERVIQAERTINDINPDVSVEIYNETNNTKENADRLLERCPYRACRLVLTFTKGGCSTLLASRREFCVWRLQ